MKYLKLFEAFESNILSKTLSYLSDMSKGDFMKAIKNYCEKIDFPLSKISDDYFQYLAYNKALKSVISSEDKVEDCKATSKEVFGDKSVGDDICTGGKLKRIWGKGVRSVDCPKCLGTGKIKVGDPDAPKGYELIKFWINNEKDIISVTLTDGKKGDSTGAADDYVGFGKVYDSNDSLDNIPHLHPVIIRWSDESNSAIGTFYKPGGEWRCYVIHNIRSKDGSEPGGRDWKKYGKYSWSVGGGSYQTIQMCKKSEVAEGEINYYEYNKVTDFNFKTSKTSSSPHKLEGSNFAIVFDTGKLKNSEYVKKSEITKGRDKVKSGIIGGKLGIKDVDIKKQNLDKYIKALASKGVKGEMSDLASLDNYIFRVLGGKNLIFKFIKGEVSDVDKIINSFFKMLKVNEEYGYDHDYSEEYYRTRLIRFMDKNTHLRDKITSDFKDMVTYYQNNHYDVPTEKILKYLYDNYVKGKISKSSTSDVKSDIPNLIKSTLETLFRKSIEENQIISDEIKKSKSSLLGVVLDVSEHIYNKLKSFGKVETLIDAELLQQKITSINNVLTNDRWYFSQYMKDKKSPKEIDKLKFTNKEALDKSLEKLKLGAEEIKKIIDRI